MKRHPLILLLTTYTFRATTFKFNPSRYSAAVHFSLLIFGVTIRVSDQKFIRLVLRLLLENTFKIYGVFVLFMAH